MVYSIENFTDHTQDYENDKEIIIYILFGVVQPVSLGRSEVGQE